MISYTCRRYIYRFYPTLYNEISSRIIRKGKMCGKHLWFYQQFPEDWQCSSLVPLSYLNYKDMIRQDQIVHAFFIETFHSSYKYNMTIEKLRNNKQRYKKKNDEFQLFFHKWKWFVNKLSSLSRRTINTCRIVSTR